jgi:DNA-binding response OmpR family regulator
LRTEEITMAEKILVVDDDQTLANLLVNLLSMNGYDAKSCPSGMQALRSIFDEEPDLVLLDVLLPGLNGLDVLAKMRENPLIRDVPAVIMSVLSDELYLLEGWVRDSDGYISKPFAPWELLETIRVVLDKAREELMEQRAERIDTLLETIHRLEEQYLEASVSSSSIAATLKSPVFTGSIE